MDQGFGRAYARCAVLPERADEGEAGGVEALLAFVGEVGFKVREFGIPLVGLPSWRYRATGR
jgi:hypothetical protein